MLNSKGKADPKAMYMANICAPRMSMIPGMPSIFTFDKFNNCKGIIKNCTPNDITLERDDIIAILEE
jgi:hypothetical protein